MIADEKIFLIGKSALIKNSLSKVNTNFSVFFEKDKILKERLEKFLDDINISTNYFINLIDSEIIRAKNITISPKSYYSAGTSSINSSFRFYDEEINTIESLLNERINKLYHKKNITLTTNLVILLLIFYILAGFAFSFLSAVKTLEKTAEDVAGGNLDAEAKLLGKDEMGGLADSLNKMIKNLKMFITRESILRELLVSSLESRNATETLRTIVNKTGKIFEADRCFIVNYDYQNKELLPVNAGSVVISSLEIKTVAGYKFSQEEMKPYLDFMLQQKEVLVVNDVSKIIIPESTQDLMKKFEVKSFMMAPMFYADKLIGLFIVESGKGLKMYTEDEKNLFESIANQSAVVINQIALIEKIQETSEREILLREIINNILLSETLENALDLICAEIGMLFDAERVKIRRYNPTENVFSEVVSEYRKNDQILSLLNNNSYTKEVSADILNILTVKKEFFIVDDVENSSIPGYMKDFCRAISVKSLIEAPIFYKDKLLASVIIENTTVPKPWEKKNLDLLKPVCQQIAIGINLFALNDELKKTLLNETTLKEIIADVSMLDTYKEVDEYILSKLLTIFDVERAVHFHYLEDAVYIDSEKTSSESIESLISSWHFSQTNIHEILTEPGHFVIVNNVESELKNEDLKEYFRSQNINSLLIYPTVKMTPEESKKVIEITMLASSKNKLWSENEKTVLKLIIDTVSALSLKIFQKLKTEEIKRTFIATLTHDLRSPIIAEQKALEAMILKKISCSEEYLDDIYKTNEELLKIVNNLLSVYHYESGKPLLNKTEINIKELIEETVRSLKYLAEDKESQINLDISDEIPVINVDRDEISRVFSNLIGNAIKHTRKGTEIQISAVRENNNIKVAVKDNGEGIPEEQLSLIFQRFPTEKRKVGTGLGLYLSKQIIEFHNGKIWFETKEGTGTTFYFTLPI